MDYFTSDTHYGHANIIKYCNRPFLSVAEMNNVLIDNINAIVKENDTLYHLGDFAMGGIQNAYEFRDKLKCKHINLIMGNHDNYKLRKATIFDHVWDFHEYHGERSIVLCHYALRVWNKSHHGYYHLYGHSHGTLPDDPNVRSFDVGVDCHSFKPLSIKEIDEIMAKKTYKPVDHHNGKTT